jgi:hypothetical protein
MSLDSVATIDDDDVRANQLQAIGHRIDEHLLSDRERRLPARQALCASVEHYLALIALAHLFELHGRLAGQLRGVSVKRATAARLQHQAGLAAGTMWSATRSARAGRGRSDEDGLRAAGCVTIELLERSSGATAIAFGGAGSAVEALGADPDAAGVLAPAEHAIGHAVALHMLSQGQRVPSLALQ